MSKKLSNLAAKRYFPLSDTIPTTVFLLLDIIQKGFVVTNTFRLSKDRALLYAVLEQDNRSLPAV